MSKEKTKEVTESTEAVVEEKESTLYYFYSQGCGWCKRTEPLIDELNNEGGYNILKLDLADGDNNKLQQEIKFPSKNTTRNVFPIVPDKGLAS